jgi:hypothetical protein
LFDQPGSLDKRHEEEVKAAELKARAQVTQENPEIPPEAFQFRFANGVAGREALPTVPPAMQRPLGLPFHLPQPIVVDPPLPAAAGHLIADAERHRHEEERRRIAIDQARQRVERAAAAAQAQANARAQANAQAMAAAQAQIRASMEVIIHSHPGALGEIQAAYYDRVAAQAQPTAPAQVAAQTQAAAHVQAAPHARVAPRPHAFRYPSGNPNLGAGLAPPMGQRPPIIDLTDDDDAPAYRRYP